MSENSQVVRNTLEKQTQSPSYDDAWRTGLEVVIKAHKWMYFWTINAIYIYYWVALNSGLLMYFIFWFLRKLFWISAKYIGYIMGENNDMAHVSRQHHRDNFTTYTWFCQQVPAYMYFEHFSILHTLPLWTTRAFKLQTNKQTKSQNFSTCDMHCITAQ